MAAPPGRGCVRELIGEVAENHGFDTLMAEQMLSTICTYVLHTVCDMEN